MSREVFEVLIRHDQPGVAHKYLGQVRLVDQSELNERGFPVWDKFFQIAHDNLDELTLAMGSRITEILEEQDNE